METLKKDGIDIAFVRIAGRREFDGERPLRTIDGYYVMWVHWIEGIAYRKGVGELNKETWDNLDPPPKPISLILG